MGGDCGGLGRARPDRQRPQPSLPVGHSDTRRPGRGWGLRVLDAGCGEGRFARMMAERGARVTAIDLSSRMIELARGAEENDPLGIDYHVADMADLSLLPSGEFDIAVAYLSLFDVQDYQSALRELARVLRRG